MNLLLSIDDMYKIPDEKFPLAVLSYNYRSFLSWGITARTQGHYNHFMWMHRPGFFATQDWWYREMPIEKYMQSHRLKFWYDPNWNKMQRGLLLERIYAELDKPKWRTRYDLIAIAGQLFGVTGLQAPWTNICSDAVKWISIIDPRMQLEHPAPSDSNQWFKDHPEYEVYGRFVND